MKSPKAKANSIQTITKAVNIANSFQAKPESIRLHISKGNVKLGSISNISTPPVVTCHNCKNCSKYCYAIRSYMRSKEAQGAWNENMVLFNLDPDRYFREISNAVKLDRFFRWHVSGDIINARYFLGMVAVALENPKCEFLAFTKAYEIVNGAVAAGTEIPGNLHLIFSAAPETRMENPHRIPECHINFEDPTLNTYHGGAEFEYHCTGNCTECAVNGCGCFFLKSGDVAIINQH